MPSSVRFYEFAAPDKGPSRDGWNRILLDFSARPKPSLFQGIRSMVARNPGELTIWSVFRDGRIQRYASVDATRAESFVRAVRSECGFEALHERDITNVDLPDLLRIREIHLERPDIFPLGMTGAFRALGELSRQHPSETIISLMNLSEAPVDWSSERRVRGLLSEKADDFFAGIRSTRWYTIIRIASRPLVWFWQWFRFLFDPFPKTVEPVALRVPTNIAEKLLKPAFASSILLAAQDDEREGESVLADAVIARLWAIKDSDSNRPRLGRIVSRSLERLLRTDAWLTGNLSIEEIADWLGNPPLEPITTLSETARPVRPAETPAIIPDDALAILSDTTRVTPIGTFEQEGLVLPFGIPTDDRKRHVYMIGKTGTGKTTLLANMLLSDIYAGRGVGLIDPHGDLSRDILSRIPKHRTNDVVYFDSSDADYPSAFNLFAGVSSELQGATASGIVSIFKRIYGNSWGPRLEYILRNAVLSLLGTEEPTLLSVTNILTNAEYRARVLAKLDDPVLSNFWTREFERMDRRQMTEATAPILNKIGQFLANPLLRNIVLQPKNSFSPRWIMDKGKIFIVRIPKGTIGEDTMSFLGSLLVTRFQIDAMSRANLPPKDRREFCLYIDEFQNFAGDSFESILSEGRKFGLSLVLGNQYVSQIPDEIAQAVFGNVASILAFQTGPLDAGILSKVMWLDTRDSSRLQSLPRYHVLARLNLDGTPIPAFEWTTLPPPDDRYPADYERAYAVERVCREKYAKPREFVEKKIRERIAAMT